MSIVRIVYLFDYKIFGKRITPALNSLRTGSFDELQKLANEIASDDPNVWRLMDDLGYFSSDLGNEEKSFNNEQSRIAFWVTLIICHYCQEVNDVANTMPTRDVLNQLGLKKDTITALVWGKPINDLILSLTALDDKSKDSPFENPGFKIGWLSTEDIEEIKTEIRANQKQDNDSTCEDLLSILETATVSKKGLILSAIP